MVERPPANFLERLKRHYIFRIAAVYAIASWILIQIFNNVLPNIGVAKDGVRFVIIVVALGFPVILVIAWTFINPSGDGYVESSNWTRLRLRIGSVLSLIVVVLVCISGWYLWRLAVVAHVARLVVETAPVNTAPPFNPLPLSIAVLPFKNQGNDPDQQYFSDGITQEITGALGSLPGVRVISWQSTSMYRGKNISVTAIGRALNVANILVGSISRDGNHVRISTELVSAVTGFQIWSAQYDRTFKDVFAIQDDISKSMVTALQLHLSSSSPLVTDATTDINAHDYYLRGLAALNIDNAASLDEAIKDFQHAIRIDPKYAEAYASMARAYAIIHDTTNVSLDISLPLAMRAVKQALRLNPNLATAHATLGLIYMLEQKPQRAMTELRRALQLDHNNVGSHILYAMLLPANMHKEALDHYQQAIALDPNNAFAHSNLGVLYENGGDYKNAITEFQASLGLAPQRTYIRLDLASLYHRNNDDKSAVAILTGVKTDDPLQLQIINTARLVYLAQQNPSLINQAFTSLKEIDISKTSTTDKNELVTLYLLVGQIGYALKLLELSCADAPETCGDIAINPSYEALRNQAAFQKLVKKYNLKD